MIYFKFYDNPSPKSLKRESLLTKLGERISKLIGSVLNANPDFDSKIDEVKQWLIEYDDIEYHQAIREIGIDTQGSIIIKMPDNRNYGFWSDAGLTINDFKKFGISHITEDEFNNLWNSVCYDRKNKRFINCMDESWNSCPLSVNACARFIWICSEKQNDHRTVP